MYMYGAILDFHVSKDQNKAFYGILSFYPRGSDASIVRSAATDITQTFGSTYMIRCPSNSIMYHVSFSQSLAVLSVEWIKTRKGPRLIRQSKSPHCPQPPCAGSFVLTFDNMLPYSQMAAPTRVVVFPLKAWRAEL